MTTNGTALNCPSREQLKSLLDGQLDSESTSSLTAHVDQCVTCQALLESLTVGTESWVGVADELKQPVPASSDGGKLAEAIVRMKTGETPTEGTDERRDERIKRSVDDIVAEFLVASNRTESLGRLGSYEVTEVLGYGGFGVVFKAFDPALHRVVAVKVLASHLAHHAVARKRFIREAQAAAAVCHENVITIHGIDEAGGMESRFGSATGRPNASPRIVMQFVEGGSVQERIEQEGPLELKEILRIGMQTAAGLAAAHAQGLVHRDVKPGNILLENGVQRVKLTDFGLARVVDDASLTMSGVIAGTPQYMSPEQAWGRVVDHRADLFSLGASLYAMCVGHSPFRARSTMGVLKRVCEEEPRPIQAINPDIPEWLSAIVMKLLAKNPDDRFQSASAVSELLAGYLAHVQQPTLCPEPSGWRSTIAPAAASGATAAAKHPVPVVTPAATVNEAAKPTPSLSYLVAILPLGLLLSCLGYLAAMQVISGHQFGSFLIFVAMQLIAAAAVWSVFHTGWNTSRTWLRLLCVLVLMFGLSITLWLASYSGPPTAVADVGVVHSFLIVIYVLGLVLLRPLLIAVRQHWPRPALSAVSLVPKGTNPWRRVVWLSVIPVILLVAMAFFATREMSIRSQMARAQADFARQALYDQELRRREQLQLQQQLAHPLEAESVNGVGPLMNEIMSAEAPPGMMPGMPSVNPGDPFGGNSVATKPHPQFAALQGRWVVLSIQGNSPPDIAGLSGSPGPMGSGAGIPMAMGGASGMSMSPGPGGTGEGFGGGTPTGATGETANAPKLLEFANSWLTIQGDRAQQFAVALPPKRSAENAFVLSRLPQDAPSVAERVGIFVVDGDRLVICWRSANLPPPTKFEPQAGSQVIVCRREWQAPAAEADRTDVKLPRAVEPFTEVEAVALQGAWAKKLNAPVEITNSIGMKLRLIPPGQLVITDTAIGSPTTATTGPIYVGTYEVTRGQFAEFVKATGYLSASERWQRATQDKRPAWNQLGLEQTDEHPVVHVDFEDVLAFCHWLGQKEGRCYRPLSSLEWTYNAHCGGRELETLGTSKLRHRLQFFTNTSPVGSYSANPWGLHDLYGNAAELLWSLSLVGWSGRLPIPDDLVEVHWFSPDWRTKAAEARTKNWQFVEAQHLRILSHLRPGSLGGDFQTNLSGANHRKFSRMLFDEVVGGTDSNAEPLTFGFRVAISLTPESLLPIQDDWSEPFDFRLSALHAHLKLVQPVPPAAPGEKAAQSDTDFTQVVVLSDVIREHLLPFPVTWEDFEVERTKVRDEQGGRSSDSGLFNLGGWKRVDVRQQCKRLERYETETDPVPERWRHPALTSPIPKSLDQKLLEASGRRDLSESQSNSEDGLKTLLFRFYDFGPIEDGNQRPEYAYRYRLKYRITGIDTEESPARVTPWKLCPSAQRVEPLPPKESPRS